MVDRLDGHPGLRPSVTHRRHAEAAGALGREPYQGVPGVQPGPEAGQITAPARGQAEPVRDRELAFQGVDFGDEVT
ncbi:hypothetical protein ACWFRQ_18035 [Streptomyces niveus]